jgi:hypothetical protein
MELVVSDVVMEKLAADGYDPQFGAARCAAQFSA